MRNFLRKAAGVITVLFTAAVTFAGCADMRNAGTAKEDGTTKIKPAPASFSISGISKHGNVTLDAGFDDMKKNNVEVGDIITVYVGDNEYDVPVGTSYTDADSGKMICRFDLEDNRVVLAVNMGSFAAEAGIGEKQATEEEPGYKWDIKIPTVKLVLKEKRGYADEYSARNLTRTNGRGDYAALTDEEFANFRAVSVAGMKENLLYRSSTPLDSDIKRNEYVMAAMEKAGIKTVVNLGDSVEAMKSFASYAGSYYSKCNIINPEMEYDFESAEFAERVRDSVLFITGNEGPYLIHCKEGKDRTGILCAVLECFAGAPADDVINDYMISYYNFYNVRKSDAAYGIILNNNLIKTLNELFDVDDIRTAKLKAEAEEYLLSAGLTENDLNALREILIK